MSENSDELAKMLLADIGLAEPDEDAKAQALASYGTMIATLERIP